MKSSPIVPGHEIIGRVAAVSEGETVWKLGDRIGGAWHGGHDGNLLFASLFKKALLISLENRYL